MMIPEAYEPVALSAEQREGWLDWSLDFFTELGVLQTPYVDITLQLDVTEAYAVYQSLGIKEASFFAFLVWHCLQAIDGQLSFKLRKVENDWFVVNNPPIVIPVAVGGKKRFAHVVLENAVKHSFEEFSKRYRAELNRARAGQAQDPSAPVFYSSLFFGNLPNLQFTGLTTHYRLEAVKGQTQFYFGKRYRQDGRLYIPFAAKLHHACTDPFVLEEFVQAWFKRLQEKTEVRMGRG